LLGCYWLFETPARLRLFSFAVLFYTRFWPKSLVPSEEFMNSRLLGRVSSLALALVLFGCNKAADQSAANGPDNPTAGSDSSSGSASASKSAAAKPKPPELKPIVIPAETVISVVNDTALSSKTAQAGDSFPATVEEAVAVEGKVVIPKGARATGVVQDAKAAGRFKGASSLELALTSITINDKEYRVKTSAPTLTHKGKGKRTAVMAGGGAGAGALIGGLAGGGKGALIGGLVGAGAGTAGAAFTGKADVVVPAESGLNFKLVEALEIKR
jgi:hypothetical protein